MNIETEAAMDKTIIMYSTTWCGDCRRSKRWLNENNVPFKDVNIEENEEGLHYVVQINNGSQTVPTIVFPDGAILVEPSNTQLAVQVEKSLGISTPDSQKAH